MKRYIAGVILLITVSGFVTELARHQGRQKDLENFTPEMQAEFDRLSDLIHDPSPEKRVEAVEGFGSFGSIEAIPLLAEALRDANSGVKIAAIKALERIDYRIGAVGCANLLRLARDPDGGVRAEAERSLPRLCDWRAVPLILEEAQRKDCPNRAFLFSLLGHCTGPEIPSPQAAESVSSQDAETRLLKAWQEWYERRKDETPADWLADDLAAAGPEGRARAAELLGKVGDAKSAPRLIEALGDEDANVRRSALNALVRLRAKEAAPGISTLYLVSEGAEARECEKALRKLAGPEHIEALAAALAQADKKKQGAYFRFLEIASGCKSPEGADAVEHWAAYGAQVRGMQPLEIYALGLKDPDQRNRLEAARRLEKFGPAAVDYLLGALEDESQAVRSRAVKSLRAATFHHEEFPVEGTAEERREAARRWGAWWESKKGEEPVKRLTAQLRDRRDARNRAEAAIGLKEADAWEAVPHLIEALEEENEGLRYYAACGLRSITKQSFGFESNALLQERNMAVSQWRAWWNRVREMSKESALIATIKDMSADKAAKIRAVQALVDNRSLRALLAIADLLDDGSFVLSSIAEEALEQATGKSFFYDLPQADSVRASTRALWLNYLESLGKV